MDRRAPEGLRRDRMGRRAAGRRPGRSRARRHAVRDRRLADQGAARVRLRASAPGSDRDQRHRPGHDPHAVQPAWTPPSASTSCTSTRRSARSPPRSRPGCRPSTRCTASFVPEMTAAVLVRRRPRLVRRHQRGAEAVQRGPALRRASSTTASTWTAYPLRRGEGRLPAVPRARRSREGLARAVETAGAAGERLVSRGEDRPPHRAGGVDEQHPADPARRRHEVLGEITPGGEGRACSRRAKAVLFPIDWDEPFGLVMTEAMACGTPVIATPRGSVPEVVADGETGWIVDVEDYPARGGGAARQASTRSIRAPAATACGALSRRRPWSRATSAFDPFDS